MSDLDFDVFEAVCGVQGDPDGPCCGASTPRSAVLPGVVIRSPDDLPCTRRPLTFACPVNDRSVYSTTHVERFAPTPRWPSAQHSGKARCPRE